jgi:meso-butanediol dehydrogenase / (S,S)-butanediol dehydrogenase / diacetyl reductase
MTDRLKDKVALITGTAQGQGRAAAIRFAREGACVVGCDLNADGADETARMVKDAGGSMVSMAPVNLSMEEEVRAWMDFAVAAYGDFDILYNNASGARMGGVEDMSKEDFDYTLANETTLVFLAIKHAIPVFRRRGGGNIINTASIAGMMGGSLSNLPGVFAHGVAKAGVLSMTRSLAIELSPLDIRVNAISPGPIDTPGIAHLMQGPAADVLVKSQLIPRKGVADDVAGLALFLASDDASFITGANMVIDGGLLVAGGAGRPGSAFASELADVSFDFEFN